MPNIGFIAKIGTAGNLAPLYANDMVISFPLNQFNYIFLKWDGEDGETSGCPIENFRKELILFDSAAGLNTDLKYEYYKEVSLYVITTTADKTVLPI